MSMDNWEIIAKKWRTVEETVEKLSIVQRVTKSAIEEIKENKSLTSARDFLNASVEDDEDDDLP